MLKLPGFKLLPLALMASLSFAAACGDKDDSADDTAIPGDDSGEEVDADGDGSPATEDCDDDNGDVYPGADEVCDGLDNDCNDQIDDAATDASVWYPDADGDGYGDGNIGELLCEQPSSYVDNASDCDDTDASVNPDGLEVCDPDDTDEDCDGLIDDADDSVDPAGYSSWHPDSDGDGYGDPGSQVTACDGADSSDVQNGDDCDDTDAALNPDDGCGDTSDQWDGTYQGTVQVSGSVTQLGLSDTCTGPLTLTVDNTGNPQLDGAATCTFAGAFAALVPGPQAATVTGEINGASGASGEVDIGGLFQQGWSGSFSGDADLDGSFSGSTTYQGFAVTYSGSFTSSRQ